MALKGTHLTEEHKRKLRENHVGMKGRKHTSETKEKMRAKALGRPMTLQARLKISGANNHMWKGGSSPIQKRIRMSYAFKIWRMRVFRRDEFKCVVCGHASKGTRPPDIHVDHIKPFAYFPELRFELSNGRTLCVPCHKLTDSWGYKAIKNYG